MPENPLLPNAQLRALHALLQRATEQSRPKARKRAGAVQARVTASGQEALLAGTLVQLCPGDILVTGADDLATELLNGVDEQRRTTAPAMLRCGPDAPKLALAAGLAEGFRRAGSDRVVLAVLHADSAEPAWADTLAWVQDSALPLVLACSDRNGADAFRTTVVSTAQARSGPLTWSAVSKVAGGLKLPVLSVDGEDAVAVYRVMQESTLRARSGGGPAILWAMLSSEVELAAKRPKSAQPLKRLEHYLKTRQIAL